MTKARKQLARRLAASGREATHVRKWTPAVRRLRIALWLSTDPRHLDRLVLITIRYSAELRRAGQFSKAQRAIDSLPASCRDHPRVVTELAKIAQTQKDWPLAIVRWEAAGHAATDSRAAEHLSRARAGLAAELRRSGDLEGAELQARRATESPTADIRGWIELARIATASGSLELAVERWDRVEALLDRDIDLGSGRDDARLALATECRGKGDLERALTLVGQISDDAAHSLKIRALREEHRIHTAAEAWPQAELVARRIIEIEPAANERSLIDLASSQMGGGNVVGALATLAHAWHIKPGSLRTATGVAKAAAKASTPEERTAALETLEKFYSRRESRFQASDLQKRTAHVAALLAAKLFAAAFETARAAQSLLRDDSASSAMDWATFARCYRANHHYVMADELIAEALERFGDEPELLHEAIMISRLGGSLEQTVHYWDRLRRQQAGEFDVNESYRYAHDTSLLDPAAGLALAIELHNSFTAEERGPLRDVGLLSRIIRTSFVHECLEPTDAIPSVLRDVALHFATAETAAEALGSNSVDVGPQDAVRRAIVWSHMILLAYGDLSEPLRSAMSQNLRTAAASTALAAELPILHTVTMAMCSRDVAVPEDLDGASRELDALSQPTPISPKEILTLERLLAWNGYFVLASKAREAAARLAWEAARPISDPASARLAAWAGLEFQDPSRLWPLLLDIEAARALPAGLLQSFRAYAQLLQGEPSRLQALRQSTAPMTDPDIAQVIRGRSVAIVAPAAGANRPGAEIDAYDLVLRINTVCSPPPSQSARQGTRFDIASFNTSRVRAHHLSGSGLPDVLPDSVSLVLWRSVRPRLVGNPRTRFAATERLLLPNTVLNSGINHVPLLLPLLLSLSPARVKVFNSNFFLSEDRYVTDYRRQTGALFQHQSVFDAFDAGHRLARRLWSLKLVEFCPEGEAVLQLETDEYIREMQKLA